MADPATLRRIMVDTQVRPSDVTRFPIISAMLETPREAYVPAGAEAIAYAEEAIPLGNGRELLEPRTLAKVIDALAISPDEEVLVVGAALGYTTALLSRLAASVVAVEEDAALYAETEANLAAQEVLNAAVIEGPLAGGAPKAAPFDAIFVDGGVETVPEALTSQLKDGGRIAVIVQDVAGRDMGEMRIGRRIGDRISWRMEFNAGAAPLPGFAAPKAFAL
ncbi:protein-L-isoaspartate O-methyltransferase [Jannaschia sp. Os4]|uniref:protein-L-isoaspartate O-methyltransferase family protein n=1 Tax=Jannaschia sp. Os4 TaxID=2807617 RepID=UPI0019393330|nr:protein-L-isoaspartate O-methyltransferase [Jannaschia sp. Os4]MBM2576738.1 protein-L-isoaspartate O-methyltransferase [Jannaschia sp. Os4]